MITTVSLCGDYLPDRCGVVHYTHQLLRGLAGCGVESVVLTTHCAARTERDERLMGVIDRWDVRALPPLTRAIRRLDPDVVHIQFAPGSYRFKRAISDRVHFTGHVGDTDASLLLSGSDIGVIPFNHGASLKSSSLLTLLAYGLPAVTTEHDPSIPEIRPLARLVPPRDSERLAGAVMSLLADRSSRSRLSAAGQAYAARYSWTTIAGEHVALYEQVLTHKPGRSSDFLHKTVLHPPQGDSTHAQSATR